MRQRDVVVGVIADTHGLVRPQALAALAGVGRIVHAGDVGAPAVLEALERIAPVVERGNNDRGVWAARLPETAAVAVAGARLWVLHDVQRLDLEPAAAGFAAVIAGHSHRPALRQHAGVLWVNPGSAGPRRFSLPVAVARLRIAGGRVHGEIVELTV
jgi:putative phosphoesterase